MATKIKNPLPEPIAEEDEEEEKEESKDTEQEESKVGDDSDMVNDGNYAEGAIKVESVDPNEVKADR